MRNTLTIIILIVGILGGVFAAPYTSRIPIINAFYPISVPVTLEIPKLHIQTSIEYVATDPDGRMSSPKDEFEAAWYEPGVKPGEKGNAVIAGHYDSKTGPALFYNLSSLKPGDVIIVTDKNNKKLTFKVTDISSYPDKRFPIEKVFGTNSISTLNLITCDGIFDPRSQNYSRRLVVFSHLVDN